MHPHRRRASLPALLLLPLALAGCSSGAGGDDGAPQPQGPLAHRLLAAAPAVGVDVEGALAWWEDIARNYPKHDSNLPTNAMLRDRIVADMQALGFEVEVRSYPGAAQGQVFPEPVGSALPLDAIVARKPGTVLPERAIALVSHYDTQAGTIMGAYDDASGVAAEYAICKALAAVPLHRTLDCIFFDGEERGLAASKAYVDDVVVEGDEGITYDFVIGYDMVGINWPGHSWKLYAMVGEEFVPQLHPFMVDLLHGALGYPEEGVEVLDVHDRNSDERRFKEAGVPIVRFAGGRHATDYPMYHRPGDLVEYVDLFVGGRPNFEAGMRTVLESGVATVLALDRADIAEMP
ncbi:MAG TPA: M28 family peptidase [Candidatus Thermoplasmatota archaeon]|nr:M28 family peptidase [Candidatus Thermoplasmatota archaeon]